MAQTNDVLQLTGPISPPVKNPEVAAATGDARSEAPSLLSLIHHRQAIDAATPLAEVQRQLQSNSHEFVALVEDGRVVGLCSRATVGFLLGSRYGFALYGKHPVWDARAPRPLIYPVDAPIHRVLDEAFSRAGGEFFEDIVLVDGNGALIGLVPVPSLARLQVHLFAEQMKRVVEQDHELRQQNLELFQVNSLLRQSQGRYKALFENNALGVAVLDAAGRVVANNRRFQQLFGRSESAPAESFPLAEWVVADERPGLADLLVGLEREAPQAEPRVAEFHFATPTGPRLFEIHASWVIETGQICLFFEDITAQRTIEQSVARQEKQNMLDTLVAGVAHELNNKLTPVLGFADLLQAIAPPEVGTHARKISQSAREAAQIIRQLLSLSRPSGNAEDLLDLAQIVREGLDMLRFQQREARCEIKVEAASGPAYVRGDGAQLKQVLINLVLNALHAMADCPAPRLVVRIESVGNSAAIHVCDNGSGIKPENLSRIFDPFFTTKGPRGTGLGLSISSSIIRQLGGEITVSSVLGQGSTFTVRLPRCDGTIAQPAASAPVAFSASADSAVRRHALIIDDEEFVRQFMQEALRSSFGCTIDTAVDGADALGKLARGNYDLILTDIRMPRMDGWQVLEWIRRNRPELVRRTVFVTGHAGSAETEGELNQLPGPVVRKPFTLDAIRDACREYLAVA